MDRSRWGRGALLASSLIYLGGQVQLASANSTVGAWNSPAANNWPLIAVHAALTPDGRVLTYGTDENGRQTGFFIYDVWDPAGGLVYDPAHGVYGGHTKIDNMTGTDIFCSSQVILPETGNILISGGDNWQVDHTTNTGNKNSNIFSYTSNTLTRGSNMNRERWYSSSTVLLNGEVYIQGGNGGGDRPEVRQRDGTFRLLSGVDTSTLAATFPRNFLAPDGRVFGFDSNGRMYYVNTAGTGTYSAQVQFPSSNAGWTSSAAMYRPGKILQMGGNSRGSMLIDFTGPTPTTRTGPDMSSQRQWVSATVLADGRVLATGGSSADNQLTNVNTSAEIWDPNANPLTGLGAWTQGPNGSRARLYHSGAVLLPDASVLITGGGAPGPLANLHSEIYYPSYLYATGGGFAPRPAITDAPGFIEAGQDFSILTSGRTIERVTIVKTGSVTHSVNMDQRFLELPFSESSGTLFVQMPDNFGDTPPGYYLLFAFDDLGVPSIARMLRINIPQNPVILTDYTTSVGGAGGSAFSATCNPDEVVVGIYGNSAGTYVNRAGVQCVKIDQAGRWIGDPVNRNPPGGPATGAAYAKTCARDAAISGFRGRASQFVNQLDFQCRSLNQYGQVIGGAQYLGAVGGTGGTAVGPFSCSTNNPVYALNGRASTQLDQVIMLCRQAQITRIDINTAPSLTNPGPQVGSVGVPVTLQVQASDDGDPLSYSATNLPPGLSINAGTGFVSGTPSTEGSFAVTLSVSDGQLSTSANLTWTIAPQNPLVLDPMPQQAAKLVNAALTYTATTHNGINTQYKWDFDDGTNSNWSSSPSVTHAFTSPTLYWVSVTAKDDRGIELTQTFSQLVHRPLTSQRPRVSANLALTASRLWVVNQDNDTVSVFNVANNAKLAEIAVGTAPRAVAIAPSGEVWITNRRSASISVIDPGTLAVTRTINLPRASQPFGLVFSPTGDSAFVALEGAGKVLRLNPATGVVTGTLAVGANPRHLSITADGTRLYVSQFITPRLPDEETANVLTQEGGIDRGGQVQVLDTTSMAVITTVVLRHSDVPDFQNQGSGVPNYLGAAVISPDGTNAWVPSKQDNIKRGTLRNNANLNFQNTVRAISSSIDLATNAETYSARLDHDNASVASAGAYEKYGVFLFVALETSREVAIVDANNQAEFFRIPVGRAPQGVVVSDDGLRLYVSNFMDRTVSVHDLSPLINQGQWNLPLIATLQAVASEKLSATVLKGKQFFYDARDTRLAREGYMSCASCHNDGGQDGRIWDLTGMNEGLRNTVSLRGRAGGQGFIHWSANFDEIQDFEAQIRSLAGGTGLMSDSAFNTGTRSQPLGIPKAGVSADLDALAAYVASLNSFDASPFRNADGTLTTDAVVGRDLFRLRDCSSCHTGNSFTDSAAANLHDVGTIKQPTSGTRLGGTLTGIDTPTLRDVWQTAPYLHDGSAATLEAAVRGPATTPDGLPRAHAAVSISDADLAKLVAYLKQIDSDEPPPVVNSAPVIAKPGTGNRTAGVGQSVSLQVVASDANGDTLTYAATGLPAGLSINATSGLITGRPTTVAVYNPQITASDGLANASVAFKWTVAQLGDTSSPTKPGNIGVTLVNGQPSLTWAPSTDNVGVTGYEIHRSTNGTYGPEVARVTTNAWTDSVVQEGVTYTYAMNAYDAAGNRSPNSPLRGIVAGVAPSPPGTATGSLVNGQPRITWGAATDNVAVTGYIIYRSTTNALGPEVARVGAVTTWTDTAQLAGGIQYFYAIKAFDAAGLVGARSNWAKVIVP